MSEPLRKNDNENSSSTLKIICQLVGFLIANITKTEQEWLEWGNPFLQMVFTSQFHEAGSVLFTEFEEQFYPLVGHGVALWIEETISVIHNSQTLTTPHPQQGFDDYVIVTSMEEKLSKVLAEYLLFSPEDVENTLTLFFTKFYQHLEQIDHYYDSRERNIARKVCAVLNLSAHKFSQLEKELQSHSTSKSEKNDSPSAFASDDVPADVKSYPVPEENNLFLTLFQQHSQRIPKESLLVSYRMWRVAFIAAGGGAMVGLAGFIAAPSIVSTVIPVLCQVGTFGQLSVTFDTFLSYVGVLTYPLIPSIFTTYGATVAGTVMMKRTAAIREFELLPLHIHHKTGQNPEIYEKKDKTGIPIFILVNGHVEKHVDARVMWGANGTDLIVNETTVTSLVVKPTLPAPETNQTGDDVLIEKNYDDTPDVGILSSTMKELQQELLQESKLIAETIVQSIQQIHPVTGTATNSDLATDSFEEVQAVSLPSPEGKEDEENDKSMHEWEELDYSYSQGWWKEIDPFGEEYLLTWENHVLSQLTESILSMIKHKISSKIMGQFKEFFYQQITPLHAIKKSIGLPNLAIAKIKELDDVWMIAMDRAYQGGKLLAQILMKQYQPYLMQRQQQQQQSEQSSQQGDQKARSQSALRPITLIGYGMGARLIYHCLEALLQESRQQYGSEEAVKGLIENVVLIGAPVKIDLAMFQSFRSIVASRFINCYSRYDWILALLYRSRSYELLIAGLYPIYLPGQSVQQPTKIANQKELLFIQKVETKDEQGGLLSIDLQSESEVAEETLKQQQRMMKEKDIKAQLQAVGEEVRGIENYDVTDIVYLQTDYPKVLPAIMKLINLQPQ